MDKAEFLTKILNIYGRAFGKTDEGISAKDSWIESCFEVLPNKNCNYDRLWLHFLKNFDCRTILEIPSPQWLYQASQSYIEEKTDCEALINIQNMPKGEPPPPEWFIRKQKLFEKNFGNAQRLYN